MRFLSILKRCVKTSYVQCRSVGKYHLADFHPSTPMTAFVEKQLHLLEIEHLAEVEEKNFEAANLSLKILQRFELLFADFIDVIKMFFVFFIRCLLELF